MNILVVTTFNNKLEQAYAHRFRDTYNWPFELKIYNEDLGKFVTMKEEMVNQIENKLSQSELVALISIIKTTLDERNNGVGDFMDVRFITHI